jgi:hypothetical protein
MKMISLLLLIGVFFGSTFARAEDIASPPIKLDGSYKMRITPVAGLNLTTTTLTDNVSAALEAEGDSQSSGPGYAAGILVGLIFYPHWETEFGLLYSHQRINGSYNDPTDNLYGSAYETFNTLQIPVVERFEFLPGLSAGGGVYYAHGVGSVSTTTNITGAANGTISSSYENYGLKRNDFGLVFNAHAAAPLANAISLVFDARYLLGLLNLDSSGDPDTETELREVQFLAGMSFEF